MQIPKNNNNSCINIVNNFTHTREKPIDNAVEILKSSFEMNPSYNLVKRNFTCEEEIKVWIYEGNEKDKIIGYKYIQSYPYDEIKFEIGDYILWKYGDSCCDTTWLLISLDKQLKYDIKGRMLLCNNTLKWIDENGKTISLPCVIEDSMSYTNFKFGNSGLVEQGGDIVVLVQKNKNTKKISVNDRFLFDNRAYRVKQQFNELNPNYLEIYMSKVSELQGDNIKDNIARNDDNQTIIIDNNTIISPNVSEILEGKTVNFNVYKYSNKIKQSDTFTFISYGVPNVNYILNIIDGNNFSITNLKQYIDNTLTVQIKNNTTNEIITKKYWIGGKW